MTLDARHRTSIYTKLVPLLGDEDTNALMTEFPSLDVDELVTKQFLRAELAELRGELRGEIAGLRTEMRTEMHDLSTRLMTWTISTMLAGLGIAFVIGRALG